MSFVQGVYVGSWVIPPPIADDQRYKVIEISSWLFFVFILHPNSVYVTQQKSIWRTYVSTEVLSQPKTKANYLLSEWMDEWMNGELTRIAVVSVYEFPYIQKFECCTKVSSEKLKQWNLNCKLLDLFIIFPSAISTLNIEQVY